MLAVLQHFPAHLIIAADGQEAWTVPLAATAQSKRGLRSAGAGGL